MFDGAKSAARVGLPPHRLLVRASAGVLAASLVVVTAGQALGGWIAERNARAVAQVAAASGDVARAHVIAGRFARLAAIEPGPEHRAAEAMLIDGIAMLVEADRAAGREGEHHVLLLNAHTRLLDPTALTAAEAERLHAIFTRTIVPARAADARLAERRAEAVAAEGRILFWTSALVQVFALFAAGASLLLPAIRRSSGAVRAAATVEEQARQRLLHDPLTGLPNLAHLSGVLAGLVANTARRGLEAAVFRIDLERFGALRDALGQRAATEIVRIAARRLQNCMRGGDFAAHLGQDRFVVVATDLVGSTDTLLIGQRLHAVLSQPYALVGGTRRIGTAIGVALLSDDTQDAEQLLGNAEIALAKAKRDGGGLRHFNDAMGVEAKARETLCAEILGGIEAGAFVPYFQPQLRLDTGEFLGFEALARWRHPERGVLEPRAFLDAAERADLMEPLGERIVIAALDALVGWDAAGLAVPCVGVNFALAQLHDPMLIERIKGEVDRRDLAPSRLAIEVLETVLIKSDANQVVRNLRGLASAGFQIDLDDFGTGHASISNLRRFAASRIKIDVSFVRGADASGEQQRLIGSIIAMARALGIRTLAEGVETAGEEAVLRAMGCEEIQGFRIAAPMDEETATAWLAARPCAAPEGERITP